jgi:hypothetical protein
MVFIDDVKRERANIPSQILLLLSWKLLLEIELEKGIRDLTAQSPATYICQASMRR